ncbi:unnamed protein product, partial [Rotaria magnacalcarata]
MAPTSQNMKMHRNHRQFRRGRPLRMNIAKIL